MTFLLFVLSRPPFQRPWPVDGGEANPPAAVPPSLILTGSPSLNILKLSLFYIFNTNWPGHEDGKVKVWLSRQNSLRLLTALDTARCFLHKGLVSHHMHQGTLSLRTLMTDQTRWTSGPLFAGSAALTRLVTIPGE